MTKEDGRAAHYKYIADIKAQWKLNAEKDGGSFRDDLQWCDGCGCNAMIYRFEARCGTRFQCMCCGSYYGPEAVGTYFRTEQPEVDDVE